MLRASSLRRPFATNIIPVSPPISYPRSRLVEAVTTILHRQVALLRFVCVCVIIIMTTPTSRDYDSAQEAAAVTTDHNNNFPSRLHHFLDVVDEYHLSHIASWLPHGRGFRIHDPKAFVTITAPRFVVAVVLSMARVAATAILSIYIYPSNANILSMFLSYDRFMLSFAAGLSTRNIHPSNVKCIYMASNESRKVLIRIATITSISSVVTMI